MKPITTLCLLAAALISTLPTTEGRGGFRGGGRTGSGSGGRYSPSTPSRGGGWSRPSSPPSRPHTPTPTQPSRQQTTHTGQTGSQGGWRVPQTNSQGTGSSGGWQTSHPSPTGGQTGSTGSQAGWKVPQTSPQGSGSSGGPTSGQTSPSGSQYGWKAPQTKPSSPTSSSGSSTGQAGHTGTTGTQYGWKAPNTQTSGTSTNNHPSHPQPPKTNSDTFQQSHQPTPRPYGFQQPTPKPATHFSPTPVRPSTTHNNQNTRNQQGGNRTGSHYPTQNANPYNTGKKYEKGFGKGYDQGYQRGLQQGAKLSPAYYPQQNHFGYPGQGFTAGYGSPSYGGMHVFGTPNNYGYPVSSAYGYNTYGTGGSNHDLLHGVLLGAAGVVLINSLTNSLRPHSLYTSSHFAPAQSNPWGYTGGGYGSDYNYVRVDKTVNNNYFFNQPPPSKEQGSDSVPSGWVQCVAYDPIAKETLTNPNCSCTVSVTTDNVSNTSTAVHNCQTTWGPTVVEKTPISDVEVLDLVKGTVQVPNPEKLKELDIERRRNEVYHRLELMVNMGSFTR